MNFLNVKELNNIEYELEFISEDKSPINPVLYKKLIRIYERDIKLLEKTFNLDTKWI